MKFQHGQNVGPANARWAGDDVSPSGGRQRARKLYPGQHVCEVVECGGKAERHHKDGNTSNNDRSNIAFLCNKHHKEADGRMQRPEFRAAHRRRVLGSRLTSEHRAKISRSLTGRTCSESTRRKIAAATTARYASTTRPTNCPHGHAYNQANTYVKANGQRLCRQCACDRAKRNYYKKRGAV